MVHEFTRQTRLIVSDQRNAILSRNIFCGHDHEFIPGDAGSESNVSDSSAWNLAPNRSPKEHVGQNHVVDILRPSGYLVAPFLARNRLADDAIRIHLRM